MVGDWKASASTSCPYSSISSVTQLRRQCAFLAQDNWLFFFLNEHIGLPIEALWKFIVLHMQLGNEIFNNNDGNVTRMAFCFLRKNVYHSKRGSCSSCPASISWHRHFPKSSTSFPFLAMQWLLFYKMHSVIYIVCAVEENHAGKRFACSLLLGQ